MELDSEFGCWGGAGPGQGCWAGWARAGAEFGLGGAGGLGLGWATCPAFDKPAGAGAGAGAGSKLTV